jgi:hypothetical protein
MNWAEHAERMETTRNSHTVLVGSFEGKRTLWGLVLDGKIILKWILKTEAL